MSPDTITSVTVGTEVAKAVDKIPFTSLMKAMLGPATDELALRLQDSVRVYRYGRQLKGLEKAEQMARDAGFTPKAVPIKLLFPLLEGASLEEDEDVHTKWAALLANASNPNTPDMVHPSFANVLRQLSPQDAKVLASFYDSEDRLRMETFTGDYADPHYLITGLGYLPDLTIADGNEDRSGWVKSDLERMSFNILQSHSLVEIRFPDGRYDVSRAGKFVLLTVFGRLFLQACEAPMGRYEP